MKALIALEEMIKRDEAHIKLAKRQIAAHESGENRMTPLVKASTESSLQEATERLEKSRLKLQELLKHDLAELEKEERIREAVIRKNYYHYQKSRIKRSKTHSNDIKLEAMMIIDELPQDSDVGIEDDLLFEVAEKSFRMQLSLHENLHDKLKEIKGKLNELLGGLKDEDISELALLNDQIALFVLHLYTLIGNIEQIIEEDENLPPFKGLPRYEDWWFKELWTNHLAYFSLFKWKQIITGMCLTNDQKEAWEIIFARWVNVKKYLCTKGELGYKYTFAIDTLIKEFCDLEEELTLEHLESMESIVLKIAKSGQEQMTRKKDPKQLITPYAQFKKTKLNIKE